jgi:hypothetical protein
MSSFFLKWLVEQGTNTEIPFKPFRPTGSTDFGQSNSGKLDHSPEAAGPVFVHPPVSGGSERRVPIIALGS